MCAIHWLATLLPATQHIACSSKCSCCSGKSAWHEHTKILHLVPFRFRRIAQLYSQGLKPLAHTSMELSNWNWLYNATDKLTKGWLKHGAKLLQQVTASARASQEGSADEMQRLPSNASSSSSWQSVCGDAFGHTMMDQQLTKLMSKTSGSGVLPVFFVILHTLHRALPIIQPDLSHFVATPCSPQPRVQTPSHLSALPSVWLPSHVDVKPLPSQ